MGGLEPLDTNVGNSYCQRMRGRFVTAAVFAGVVVNQGIAAQAPPLGRLVVLGESERTVNLLPAEDRDARVGRLNLLVRNSSSRPVQLRIRFFADSGDKIVRLRPLSDAAFSADQPTLYTDRIRVANGRLMLLPRHTALLPLRFGVAKDAKADVVTGTLVVAAQANPRVESASVQLTGQLPAATEAKLPAAQPPKVTLRVQRWLPGGARDGWRRVNEPLVWVPGGKSNALVLLSSGSGHSMKVRVANSGKHPPVPDGVVEQRLKVADLDAVGTYAGELTLKPGGTDKIDVEAKVRDVILWPLIVVTIASLIGGLGVTRLQRWRTRRILLAEVERARRDYVGPQDDSPMGPLDDASDEALAALESEISAAESAEELDELTERVRDVRKSVDRWNAIDDAASSLLDLQDAPPDAGDVQEDTRLALDATRVIPTDDAAAGELVRRLRRQARLVRAFDEAYLRWRELAVPTYREHKGAYADEAKTAALLGLLDRVREPDLIILVPEERQERARALIEEEGFAKLKADQFAPEREAPVARVQLTPEQIERPVRRWDRRLAIATFVVTVFAFVLGLYDDDFGQWDDYAKALAAGLLGQVGGAALWNLFPALRSYRLPFLKAAK